LTTDLDAIETAIIANLRVIREQGQDKSASTYEGNSIKAYKVGDIIRIDVRERHVT